MRILLMVGAGYTAAQPRFGSPGPVCSPANASTAGRVCSASIPLGTLVEIFFTSNPMTRVPTAAWAVMTASAAKMTSPRPTNLLANGWPERVPTPARKRMTPHLEESEAWVVGEQPDRGFGPPQGSHDETDDERSTGELEMEGGTAGQGDRDLAE